MQTTRIEGRVAQVLDERRLVLTCGEADGVLHGMKFEVLADSQLQITDPITNQVLDELDQVKVRVRVVEVRERISICSTYEQRIIRGFDTPSLGSMLLEIASPTRKAPVTLRYESNELPSSLDPEESYVRRGDRAIQIVDPADS